MTLEETERLFTCRFCRVRLYFHEGNFFRFVIPQRTPGAGEPFYAPYWRFRGMYFRCLPFDVEGRVLDASYLAAEPEFLPRTLGLRPQTQRLRFLSPETEGAFLSVRRPFEEAVPAFEALAVVQDAMAEAGRVYCGGFVGEGVSLIYAPLYVKGRGLYDGVLDRPIAGYTLARREEFAALAEGREGWSVRFLPATCPLCGWDLQGRPQSLALLCLPCGKAWRPAEGGWREAEYGFEDPHEAGGGPGLRYLPFWRVRARVDGPDGGGIETVADLIRVLNLPRVVRPEDEITAPFYWFPAFAANPRVFIRLARLLTAMQPPIDPMPRPPAGTDAAAIAPVMLGDSDAPEAVKMALAAACAAKRRLFPLLEGLAVIPEHSSLVYLPFRRQGVDLVETRYGFRVPRQGLEEDK